MAASTSFVFAICFLVFAVGLSCASTIPPPQDVQQLLQEGQEPIEQTDLQEALTNIAAPKGGSRVVGIPAEPIETAVLTTQAQPTTTGPITSEPTTIADDTAAPTTSEPTTTAAATPASTTVADDTAAPTTSAPTTVAVETAAPTTVAVETAAPTTSEPTTTAAATAAPTTVATATDAPTTVAAATAAPTTVAAATTAPTTSAPTTVAPTTGAPTTQAAAITNAPAVVVADTNAPIAVDITTSTAAPTPGAAGNPNAVPFPLPPYDCYDCNSGSALPGFWRNKNCDSTGFVAQWYVPRACNTYCFSSVGLYPAGAVYRGCASSLYLKGRPMQQGCFNDTDNDRYVCLCAGNNCNTHDLSDLAEQYADRYIAMQTTTNKPNVL